MLVSWGARALYVGPGFGLSPHRNAVAVLAMGLDRLLMLQLDLRDIDAALAFALPRW